MNYRLMFSPSIYKVELEITTSCNLMCKFCDRRCSQAPSNERMSLDHVRRFVDESIQLNYQWEKIGILGGEPTLHPELEEIILILQTYTQKFPNADLFLATNYHGWTVRQKVKTLQKKIRVVKSPKNDNPKYFNNINLTQIDFGDIIHNCNIASGTGLGYTTRGYFPCGAGAAIARVLGMDIGLKSLAEVNQTSIREMLRELCPYCGHGLAIKVGNNSSTSPFWEEAYRKYREKNSGKI
ncbi:MAG TPA: radical SAM protein [Bacillota bacterium]|nr:radical SAM protein [Bacillota bacterium]